MNDLTNQGPNAVYDKLALAVAPDGAILSAMPHRSSLAAPVAVFEDNQVRMKTVVEIKLNMDGYPDGTRQVNLPFNEDTAGAVNCRSEKWEYRDGKVTRKNDDGDGETT